MNIDWKTVLAVGAVVLVIGYVVKKQAAAALTATGQAINPVSPENVFYKGAGAVTGAVTGQNVPLGTQIYDWLHPGL